MAMVCHDATLPKENAKVAYCCAVQKAQEFRERGSEIYR